MKKIIIHIEPIKKVGAKQQFQIRLPWNTKKVVGILTTSDANYQAAKGTLINKRPPYGILIPSQKLGDIWLRIPEKRDVFFADTLAFSDHIVNPLIQVESPGIVGDFEWWFEGTKREFFKINIPVESTIIEGFYRDNSLAGIVDYEVKVYLELDIYD